MQPGEIFVAVMEVIGVGIIGVEENDALDFGWDGFAAVDEAGDECAGSILV